MSRTMKSDHYQNKGYQKREALGELTNYNYSNIPGNVINNLINTLIGTQKNKTRLAKVA